MDKITHEVRLENWKAVVEQCSARPKGMTIRVWLKEQGISEKTYYYWQRKVRQEAYDQMQQTSLPAVRRDAEVTFAEIDVLQEQEPDSPARVLEGTTSFRPAAVIHTESCTIEFANSASGTLINPPHASILQAGGSDVSRLLFVYQKFSPRHIPFYAILGGAEGGEQIMIDTKKEPERDELRGAVDGWDFKNYVLGTMFYRYISENLTN